MYVIWIKSEQRVSFTKEESINNMLECDSSIIITLTESSVKFFFIDLMSQNDG